MVGAGELARMTQQAAISLGLSVRLLAESVDDGAALVAADITVGDYRSIDDLRTFAKGCDVLTFDHEHVPVEHLRTLADEGVNVQPAAGALRFAQDKSAMRAHLSDVGIEAAALRGSGTQQQVDIAHQVAAVVARSPFGQGAAWSVAETVYAGDRCVEVIVPAPALPDGLADEAQAIALRIASELDVTGVLAVGLFVSADGALLVTGLAMRPDNAANWTIEGARTSQFEQHLRAVLDYPLGATTATAPVVVVANLYGGLDEVHPAALDERVHHCLARWPDVKIHLYGKEFRPGRNVGHVTALGDDVARVRERARAAGRYLANGDSV